MPDKIANPPVLPKVLQFFYDSFISLGSCRSFGASSEGPIPITAIITYGQALDCDSELLQDLITYVELLDGVYMEHVAKKAKAKKLTSSRNK